MKRYNPKKYLTEDVLEKSEIIDKINAFLDTNPEVKAKLVPGRTNIEKREDGKITVKTICGKYIAFTTDVHFLNILEKYDIVNNKVVQTIGQVVKHATLRHKPLDPGFTNRY